MNDTQYYTLLCLLFLNLSQTAEIKSVKFGQLLLSGICLVYAFYKA
jgi:hypothetical protein